ncbi:hypothetical protein [Eubacterium sp.]|uniref:hypothetical protein n=1 Tax=Eubacterium sp. TaxID=142586 RepID=UPI0025F2388A|nr:hypothetical protein [Eubacterium sp.]MCR5629915.1 hypothetical protein [Eubacterium sp.]
MEERMSAAERFLLLSIAIAAVILALILIRVAGGEDKKIVNEDYDIKTYHDKKNEINYVIYEDMLGDVVKVEAK